MVSHADPDPAFYFNADPDQAYLSTKKVVFLPSSILFFLNFNFSTLHTKVKCTLCTCIVGNRFKNFSYIPKSSETIIWVKILKFFDADPDPGSESC